MQSSDVYAGSGCCSWHGGESGECSSDGRSICNDGTLSPSCKCFIENSVNEKNSDAEDNPQKKNVNFFDKYFNPISIIERRDFELLFTYFVVLYIVVDYLFDLCAVKDFMDEKILKYKSHKIARKYNYLNWDALEDRYIIKLNLSADFKSLPLKKRLNIIARKRGYSDFNNLYSYLKKKKFK